MTWLLVASIIGNILLLGSLIALVYYVWKFSQIILILEDDFSDAIEALEQLEASLDKILSMQLFFESKEVKMAVQESLAELKQGRTAVGRLVQTFVSRSKQKYVVVQEDSVPPPPPPETRQNAEADRILMQR